MEAPKEQSLTDHLTDLRSCLMHSLLGILLAFILCWNFSDIIFDLIRKPISPYLSQGLVFTGVMDKFIAHIKVSLLSAVIISCPYWLYQIWRFISPALYKKEKTSVVAFIFVGSLLFVSGISFVYFLVYPLAFDFLLNFAGDTDTPMITIDQYLSFFITTSLAFGFMFELPLIITFLGILGIVDKHFLRKHRRYAIVIIAVSAAMVTPPDVISMTLMMLPMLLLYELSIFSVGFFGSTTQK